MPSNWLYIDTNFPSFTGEESPDKKIETIQSYLFMLVEQLRYSLRNLDFDHNMNQTALQQFVQNVESPINTRITDVEKGLETQIIVTAEGIQTRVTSLETDLNGKIQVNTSMIEQTAKSITSLVASVEKDLDGKIQVNASQIEQTATEITAQVVAVEKDLDGKIQANTSEIRQTATSLTAKIQNTEGEVSKLEQKVDGFTLSVENQKGYSTLSLKSGGATICTSGKITLGGDVIFKSSLTDGTTIISGDNIQTGKIKADYIDADVIRTGNLKDGKTIISGANIQTGKIKADCIDVDSLKLKKLYNSAGKLAIDASEENYMVIGGNWSNEEVSEVRVKATTLKMITGDTLTITSGGIYTTESATSRLGKDGSPWAYLYVKNIYFGSAPSINGGVGFYGTGIVDFHERTGFHERADFYEVVSMSKNLTVSGTGYLDGDARLAGSSKNLGFFGSTGARKQTVSKGTTAETTVNNLITALKNYGLIG